MPEEEEKYGPISENSKNWYRKGYKPVNYCDVQDPHNKRFAKENNDSGAKVIFPEEYYK